MCLKLKSHASFFDNDYCYDSNWCMFLIGWKVVWLSSRYDIWQTGVLRKNKKAISYCLQQDSHFVGSHVYIRSIVIHHIAVSGLTEHCPIFHFPSSVLHSSVTGVTMKTIYFLKACHLCWSSWPPGRRTTWITGLPEPPDQWPPQPIKAWSSPVLQ